MRQVKKGSLNVSVDVYIIDSTDGTPELGVLFNTAGMDLEYRRELAVVVNITEATLAALTTAHADGGFLEIGHGLYRLDVPDAAFATGVETVSIQGTVTGMIVLPQTIQLVDFDPEDGVRLGLTALPNVAAGLAGGLPDDTDANGAVRIVDGTGARELNTNAGAVALVDLVTTTTTNTDMVAAAPTAAANADAVLDEDMTAHQTLGSLGQAIGDPVADATTIYQAVVTDAAGDNVSVDVVAVKAETALIVADTAGIAGAAMRGTDSAATAVELAKVPKSDGTSSWNATALAAINAEAKDVLFTDTDAEPAQGAPGATVSLAAKIGFLYKAWRNRSNQTATTYQLFNDDATTVDHKATVSDDATTAEKGEVATGP